MRGKILWIIALSLGLFSALLSYRYLSSLEPLQQPEMVEVVVAARPIGTNTVVSKDMLSLKKVPLDSIHPETVIDFNEAHGRVAVSNIVAGEPVLKSRLLATGLTPGMSYSIPRDKRAVTIGVNEVIGVAGFIKPGNYIDILVTFDQQENPITTTVLENIQVLAIAQDMQNQSQPLAKVSTSVTVAVTPKEAESLTLAEERGNLRLALRPPGATGLASSDGVGVSNISPRAVEGQTNPVSETAIINPSPPSHPQPQPQPQAPSKESPAVVAVRTTAQAAIPQQNGWAVEVIRGIEREVKLVHEEDQ